MGDDAFDGVVAPGVGVVPPDDALEPPDAAVVALPPAAGVVPPAAELAPVAFPPLGVATIEPISRVGSIGLVDPLSGPAVPPVPGCLQSHEQTNSNAQSPWVSDARQAHLYFDKSPAPAGVTMSLPVAGGPEGGPAGVVSTEGPPEELFGVPEELFGALDEEPGVEAFLPDGGGGAVVVGGVGACGAAASRA